MQFMILGMIMNTHMNRKVSILMNMNMSIYVYIHVHTYTHTPGKPSSKINRPLYPKVAQELK